MKLLPDTWHRAGRVGPGTAGFVVVASLLLAGCSIPDELNPVEWYDGVAGWFEDDEVEATEQQAQAQQAQESETASQPVPGAQEPFPNLASVPSRPERISSPEQRTEAAEGLVADREHARYADLEARRESEAAMPAPAPRAPVTAGPIGPSAPPPVMSSPRPRPAPSPPSAPAPQAVAPPPAPAPQVLAPPPAQPVPSGRSSLVAEVYRSQLARSAPTVTTAPAGPTAPGAAAPPPAVAPAVPPAPPTVSAAPAAGLSLPALTPGAAPPRTGAAAPPRGTLRTLEEFDDNAATVSFKAATLYFPRGSAKLSAKHRQVLREVVAVHRERGGTLRVIGHASSRTRNLDPATHNMVNLRISVDRADAAAKELVRLGVPSDKLFVGAKSDHEPVYYEFMPAGEAGNQRAEIYIDY